MKQISSSHKKPAAKQTLQRVIISLFDRQKDYGEIKGKRKGGGVTPPSIAIAQHKSTANASKYILLCETRYEEQAKTLLNDIALSLQQNRRGKITSTAEQVATPITLIPVSYGKDGVWDISSAIKAINKALAPISDELSKSNFKLYVNLVNGTVEQRTALALWAFRTTLARSKVTVCQAGPSPILRPVAECYFARKPECAPKSEATNAPPFEFINAEDPQKHFGFLQCKFNSQNRPLQTTLAQLELLLKRIHDVGLDDVILLTGPSGAGKTMLAKMCMKFLQCLHPEIKDENCKHINMAAIPGDLFESEFFGYAPGTFTGGLKEGKSGLAEEANGGILFLDEIGELPLHQQAKLLTFLDTGDYRRIGETEDRHSKFLLICGTNRDLEKSIPEHFRRDLYERINMWHFNVPGLHERPEDLEPAIRRELAIWNDTKKAGLHFTADALQKLLEHLKSIPLEGNYRELHAIVRRLMTLAQKGEITLDDVNREIGLPDPAGSADSTIKSKSTVSVAPPAESNQPLDYDLADLAQLAAALAACKAAKSGREAGEILFSATKAKSPTFNGSTYIQRVFEKFGLKVKFKDGKFDTIERK